MKEVYDTKTKVYLARAFACLHAVFACLHDIFVCLHDVFACLHDVFACLHDEGQNGGHSYFLQSDLHSSVYFYPGHTRVMIKICHDVRSWI